MVRVVIFGSRHLNPSIELINSLVKANNLVIDTIIEGGCRGVDEVGRQYGIANNIPIETMRADWNKYGNRAGPIRNSAMVAVSDIGICVWDGKSRGTLDTITKMQVVGKPVLFIIGDW